MNIEWKKIDEFPNYQINNYGQIQRIKSASGTRIGRVLIPKKDKYGYLQVGLWKDGKKYFRKVHRLILENFNPIYYMNELQVNHKNGIKDDNRYPENLEWTTPKENTNHSIKIGLRNQLGENHINSKLKDGEVWLIKKILNSDYYKSRKISQEFIGKMFNVERTTISSIKNGKTWSHIGI